MPRNPEQARVPNDLSLTVQTGAGGTHSPLHQHPPAPHVGQAHPTWPTRGATSESSPPQPPFPTTPSPWPSSLGDTTKPQAGRPCAVCVCVCVPGPAPPPCPGGARCRGPDPLSSPGHPPALDAPCPAVTPTGKGDFNAAAGSPPPGPAPPRHYDPPADCVPLLLISAVFPLPPPPPRAPCPSLSWEDPFVSLPEHPTEACRC